MLVQQYAAAHGAGSLARCFAGPILYDLAARREPVPAFHQVTLGNNGYYPATPGLELRHRARQPGRVQPRAGLRRLPAPAALPALPRSERAQRRRYLEAARAGH